MNNSKHKISYAQNREDFIIDSYFSDVKNGFYVDVGANHPFYHSVTKIFYDKGWSGINIEPNPMLMKQIKQKRKRDINIQVGISNKSGDMKLRVYHSQDGLEGISTFSKYMQKQYSESTNKDTEKFDDISVKVKTLSEIFSEQKVKHIHFIKIDVEGYEKEVIQGNDWEKYRPELICIEANHIFNEWGNILTGNRYHLVFNDGLNDYYLREESLHRTKLFDYANTFLSDRPVLQFEVSDKIKQLEKQIIQLKKDLNFARKLADARGYEINRLESDLKSTIDKYQEIKSLKGHFKKSVKSKLGK